MNLQENLIIEALNATKSIVDQFQTTQPIPLAEFKMHIPMSSGAYQILRTMEAIVYIGSTKNLKGRTNDHYKKIEDRFSMQDFFVTFIECPLPIARAVELMAIDIIHPIWNQTGFGTKTLQGRNRISDNGFDHKIINQLWDNEYISW